MNHYTPKLLLFICLLAFSCQTATTKEDPLAKASRQDTNGWIYVHLEGSPSTIGYQHGSLLAAEIDTNIRTIAAYLEHETKKDWNFYRQCAANFLWDKVDREYKDEINGIVVTRVNASPQFVRELIDALEDNYSKWSTREGIKNLPEYQGKGPEEGEQQSGSSTG